LRKKFDLTIVFSAPALDWMIAHGDEIFPQTPVVFTAILREQLKTLDVRANVTGVLADTVAGIINDMSKKG
jgi:hypothetical protein